QLHLDGHSFPTRRSSDLAMGDGSQLPSTPRATPRKRTYPQTGGTATPRRRLARNFSAPSDGSRNNRTKSCELRQFTRGCMAINRSEEHTSELQSPCNLVC